MKHRCGSVVTGCPAIFKSEKQTYIIIGKIVDQNILDELGNRVSTDETAIEIPVALIKEALSNLPE